MCQICDHPQREAIDRAIIAGDSLRKIGTMFGTSKSEVDRHKRICMKRAIAPLQQPIRPPVYQTAAEQAITSQNVKSVAARAEQLVAKMEGLVDTFEKTGNADGIIKAGKEVREGLRLLAQLSGELGPGGVQVGVQVNNATPSITMDPAWPVLMRCLDRLAPDIKRELLAEMAALEGRS
jgi:hypothetical protein